MLRIKQNRAAFTLIELLVVVIIAAVLAAVGVPLLSANVQRARATEAETGLGTIRTALRAYFVEHNNSYRDATLTNIGLRITPNDLNGDLDGQFYDDNDYAIAIAASGNFFCATATGNAGGAAGTDAPGAAKVDGVDRSMDQNGSIFCAADCATAC